MNLVIEFPFFFRKQKFDLYFWKCFEVCGFHMHVSGGNEYFRDLNVY